MRPCVVMRFARPTSLVLASLTILVACGDDSETTTSTGSGGAGSSSDASASSGTSDVTSSASGSDATSSASGEGGEGGGSGGEGGGEPLEVIEGPGFRSGDRLRPVYLDGGGGDGTRKLLHWYDLELDSPCRFLEDTPEGDTLECVPIGHGARILFADAACTVAVLVTDNACSGRFADHSRNVVTVAANADTRFARGYRTVFERGDALATPDQLFRYQWPDTCAAADPVEEDELVYEAREPTVSPVHADRKLDDMGGGLARAVALADDGATEHLGAVHQASGEPCQFLRHENDQGLLACAPSLVPEFASATLYPMGLIHYADDACSAPAASLLGAEPEVELPSYVVGPAEAEGELVAYARGGELDVAYSAHLAECAEHGAHVRHFAVGEPLDIAFPHVVPRASIEAEGRLGGMTSSSIDGEPLDTLFAFADSVFDGSGCGAAVFSGDGEGDEAPLRCVPGAQYSYAFHYIPEEDRYFADADCTEPLVEGDAPTVSYVAREVQSDGCMPSIVHEEVTRAALFERYEGNVWERWGGPCSAHDTTNGPSFSRYVRDVEPDEFPILTVVDAAAGAP
jgi:hypothetical protein